MRFAAPCFALFALLAPALAQTEANSPGEVRGNGDITVGGALKLGKREGNKTVITPDTLRILGPGSSGDVSGMTVAPSPSAAASTLSRLLADRAPVESPTFSGTASMSVLDVTERFRIKSGGKTRGVVQAGPGQAVIGSTDPDSEQVLKSIVVTTDGINLNGYLTNYDGGTFLNPLTYGGGPSAAGHTFATNGLIYGIPNVAAQPTVLSTYASRDHAGMTRSMRAPTSVTVPAQGSTYTATTVTNPALTIDSKIKLGMVIDTQGTPRYSGVITGIDAGKKTLTVSGWYRVDGSSAKGTPTRGVGALINPASKLWVSNDILALGQDGGHDIAGAGTELNINVLSSRVVEAYGFDAVLFGNHSPAAAYAFPARGGGAARWRAAVYGVDNLGGIRSTQTASTVGAFSVPLIETKVGPDEVFAMNHSGRMNSLRLQSVATATSMALDRFMGAKVVTTQKAAITLTLPSPADVNDGREIEVVNLGQGTVTMKKHDGAVIPNGVPQAYSQRFYAFQNDWFSIAKTPH